VLRSRGERWEHINDDTRARVDSYCRRVADSVPSFSRAVALPNLSMTTEWNPPTGLVALYEAAGPMSADFLDTTMFTGSSVYTVEMQDGEWFDDNAAFDCAEGGPVERHVQHCDPNYTGFVGDSVASLSMIPQDESGAPRHVLNDAADSAWSCHLDGPDSFVGVFTMCIRPPRRPVEEKVVIVVGNVGPGQRLQEEMFDMAEKMTDERKTFGDFTASAQYRYTCKVAERNRNRLAAHFAQLLGVRVRCNPDTFSAEKQASTAVAVATARDKRSAQAGSAQVRECEFMLEEYQDLASAMAEQGGGNIEGIASMLEDELLGRDVGVDGVDLLSLAQHLVIDPLGALQDNPYLTQSAADDPAGERGIPYCAKPISATQNSCIELAGRSAIVYRNAVPQHKIPEGHGVIMTLSRAEGVAVMHGNDCAEKSPYPFGNSDPDASYDHATPTCTGRCAEGGQVDWRECAVAAAADAPPFLRWVSLRQPAAAALHPEGRLDTVVPHQDCLVAERCVRRERDLPFMQAVKAQSTAKIAAQHHTMLDPLVIVMAPQSIRDFPDRVIPVV
jgi:hypothetical protein